MDVKKTTVATFFEVGPYSEYGPAHERATKEQRRGVKNIRIDKKSGKWWVTGVEYK